MRERPMPEMPIAPEAAVLSAPSPGARRAAGLAAAALCLGGLVSAPFASTPLPVLPGLLPVLVGATLAAHLVAAVLLFGQTRAPTPGVPVRLGAAYLFSALMAVPYILTFPGVVAGFPAGFAWRGSWGNAAWLWCSGQAGFAVLVARYARPPARDGAPRPRRAVAGVVAAVAALVLLLPEAEALVEGAGLGWLASRLAGLCVVLPSLAALALLVRRRPQCSLVDLWLCVAVLAEAVNGGLTVLGGERFSLGWYLGRGASVLGAAVVLQALLREMAQLHRRTALLAEADGLTGLANRRRFDDVLALEWRRAQRDRRPIALVIIDADHFKRFNDRYGHPAGDRCLQQIAALLMATARRPGDLAARLGGEEFALLLSGTDAPGAAHLASGLRAAMAALRIPHADAPGGVVTVSAGVAARCPTPAELDSAVLIRAADRALYRAKAAGRGGVAVDEPDGPAARPGRRERAGARSGGAGPGLPDGRR